MNNNEKLLQAEDKWVTALGAFFPGERVVFRGKDIFKDFKDGSWIRLVALGVTGREFSVEQIKMLERILILSSNYPDPRLWNNRIAALAGTVRSTVILGISGAMAVSEARTYGHRANIAAFDFITRAKKMLDEGKSVDEIVKIELKENRGAAGYGRPLTNVDERIVPVLEMARELGLGDGPHTRLAFDVDEFLAKGRWRFRMNIAGLTAALCADLDISAKDFIYLTVPNFLAGIVTCYVDACEHPEGTFFPLRCETLSYQGSAPRRSW